MSKFKFLIGATLAICSLFASAEQKKDLGPWEVHYIAVNSTFFTPEIARAYGIKRSENSTLVNISVLDKSTKIAQQVDISGNARNLLGNQFELEFKEVVEQDAVYYLAVLPFDAEDHYRFNIVLKQGRLEQTLKFEQKLY